MRRRIASIAARSRARSASVLFVVWRCGAEDHRYDDKHLGKECCHICIKVRSDEQRVCYACVAPARYLHKARFESFLLTLSLKYVSRYRNTLLKQDRVESFRRLADEAEG